MKNTMKVEINLSNVSVINALVVTDCHKPWPVVKKNAVITEPPPPPAIPPNKIVVIGTAVNNAAAHTPNAVSAVHLNDLKAPFWAA